MSFFMAPDRILYRAPNSLSSTDAFEVINEVTGTSQFAGSGTTSHWFRINVYARYATDHGQHGKIVLLFTNNPTHATRVVYKEFEIIIGSGISGGYTSTSSLDISARWLTDAYYGWNYYGLTYTVTLYKPNSGLTITGAGDDSYPLLVKVDETGNSNYARHKTMHTYAQIGGWASDVRTPLTEAIGSSTPSFFTGNYTSESIV